MLELLFNKKQELETKLANSQISEEDVAQIQELVNEYLNKLMQEKEAYYEEEKVKYNYQLQLIDELIAEVKE